MEFQLRTAIANQGSSASALLYTLNPTTIKLEEFALLVTTVLADLSMHAQEVPMLQSKVYLFAISVHQASIATTAKEQSLLFRARLAISA